MIYDALPTIAALVIGCLIGALLWWYVMRPVQLNDHERRRRDYGLPPKRELPEDQA
jgi:hypothetical protein